MADIMDLAPEDEDKKPEDTNAVPEEFPFDSKIIFISDNTEIPEALGEDCLAIQLNYTKEQALTFIESKLDMVYADCPELTLEDKSRVLAFMRTNANRVDNLTFRMFVHICTIYKSGDPMWEKWALADMLSLNSH